MNANWSTCKLGDIADVRVSNVDKKTSNAETPVKLCNYMDVYANDYVTKSIDFMAASASKSEIERFRLQAGDVIITKDSETPDDIGVPAVVTDSIDGLVCGYHLALVRPRSDIVDSIYLAKQLSTAPIARYFALNASGSTRFGLPISAIEDTRIPVAPKPEQSKIAEILSTVDRAIEQTEALIAKQQRIKTGLMQDLLTRGIDEHDNLRSEQTHQFKDSPLGRIPMEWDTRRFADITPNNAPIGYGIVQPGAYDYTGAKVAGIYTINSRFQEWYMSANRIEQAYVRSRIRPGDVLLSIKGTAGRVGVVPEETTGNISRDIARIRPIKEINPHYLRCLMLSDFFQRYLGNAEVGTTRAEISIKILRDLYVIKPPAPEQDEIVNRVRSVEQSIDQNDAMCNKLYSLKNSLMQDLLTGKCRVINRPRETKELQPYEHL